MITRTTDEFIRIGDLNIHYTMEGSGPSVLLVHGWPTSIYIWRHLIAALKPTYTVYALDLPGFGKSDKPSDAPYTFSYFSRFIGEFADKLSIDRTSLVVHDIGGPSGILWALQNPDRLRSLIILNAPIFPMKTPMDRLSQWLLRLPGIGGLLLGPSGLKFLFRSNVVNKSRMTEQVLEHYTAPFRDASSRDVLKRTILSPLQFPNELDGLSARLGTLKTPIALLFGENDPLCATHMFRLAREMSRACTVSLPRCGHYLQEDCPAEVATNVLEFLKIDR